jgi:ABC-type multidrug transport system fused ATPase/permease subunit
VFKDLAETFYKMITTLAAMVAVKCTNDGEKLLAKNYTIFSASVYIIMAYFLVWLLKTLLQNPIPNDSISIFQIILLLLLGYALSFLALTLISLNIAVITLVLWLFIFVLIFIYNNYYQQELIKTVSEKNQPASFLRGTSTFHRKVKVDCRCRTPAKKARRM